MRENGGRREWGAAMACRVQSADSERAKTRARWCPAACDRRRGHGLLLGSAGLLQQRAGDEPGAMTASCQAGALNVEKLCLRATRSCGTVLTTARPGARGLADGPGCSRFEENLDLVKPPPPLHLFSQASPTPQVLEPGPSSGMPRRQPISLSTPPHPSLIPPPSHPIVARLLPKGRRADASAPSPALIRRALHSLPGTLILGFCCFCMAISYK
ncbi:hypothetical protein K402DRAFT_169841 [Aulographum hederae CBS 113979]|uniref:Uncharacterized protein n=1 Tax=Aulographum hederae CBS 113979 TaxID=1176131 RepID=A0A6G1HD15_9PEZI|nr:hypothetical protein K402DRAFT_169841 [Aulographum hederae CBS 113979]